jgi:hypothetical protein
MSGEDRYRLAATRALEQLEWCVGYLHRIRKDNLAQALERNRSEILDRLRAPASGDTQDEASEPVSD